MTMVMMMMMIGGRRRLIVQDDGRFAGQKGKSLSKKWHRSHGGALSQCCGLQVFPPLAPPRTANGIELQKNAKFL